MKIAGASTFKEIHENEMKVEFNPHDNSQKY